ncbi:hypothetical protein Poli38472_010037 [Pythium oligandrum]|uniref:1-phosphatidylinositol 4-kinase n=1 Tax=Pythium oligandrum TaxID=41045 RepID=A0A8K1C962_PYTOL|nr:hypothetical protein Poli38472_010037 [Pythium oligandrum]|eukprot:TMW58478.1 hypothetical protein Poli38472_010037 [Pythium oligandrum]
MAANSLPGGWLESGHGSIALYVKDFRDPLERKKKLILRPWASIKDIKDQLQVVFNVPSNVQKLYYQGRELKNAHNLQECGIYQDNVVIDFVARRAHNLALLYTGENEEVDNALTKTASAKSAGGSSRLLNGKSSSSLRSTASTSSTSSSSSTTRRDMPGVNIHPYGAHLLPVSLMKIMHQALQGLALGLAPVLAMDGTGGTYFLKDPSHRNVGCFKPQDEEPFGPNNPRGLVGELGQSGLRRGILSGEACERELAAYMLDRDHFAGVPATSLVEARHPVFKYQGGDRLHFKMGSLQEFVRHDDVASDIAPSQFSTHQVHKIVLLDMRLLNTDRNDANILVRKRRTATTPPQVEYELIPIDHGYCLPQFLEIAWCDWCWYNWPQLSKPLSAEDRAYVLELNPVEDTERLSRKIPLRRACRRNMIIAGTLVQKGVKANLVLYDIAKIMCRDDLDTPSTLERMCIDAFHQLQKQKKQQTESPAPPNVKASSGQISPRNKPGRPFNLRISIDATAEVSLNGYSPSNSGARSPPGFWASHAPFSSDDAFDIDSPRAPKGNSPRSSFMRWDDIAANALDDAVKNVKGGNSNGSSPHRVHRDDDDDRASVVSSTFAGENDKDEFEVLNLALDDNLQDEKLFMGFLFRLMDEKIDECVRRQREEEGR